MQAPLMKKYRAFPVGTVDLPRNIYQFSMPWRFIGQGQVTCEEHLVTTAMSQNHSQE
jgi:hypothetical protein